MRLSSHFRFLTVLTLGFAAFALASPATAEVTETATYKVRFFTTWSAQTHPIDFPPNPHFSGLIGGVHNHSVSFWKPGTIASPGIEAMAERGQTTPLDDEVQLAIDVGNALQIVTGGGVGSSPGGSAQASFTVSQDYPLITLVSMLAPSPDWFVGVRDLDLRSESDWLEQKVVTLYAWDAGTDNGTTYRSPDQDASPRQPIALIEDGPVGNGTPVGSFTFTRQDDPEPDALELLDGRFKVSAEWQKTDLERGRARAVQLQDESGYLWFFSQGNIEVVVRVEDTLTGQVNIYANNLGEKFQPIQDTDAFATCDVSP